MFQPVAVRTDHDHISAVLDSVFKRYEPPELSGVPIKSSLTTLLVHWAFPN